MQEEVSNDPGNVETTQGDSTRKKAKKKTSKKKASKSLAAKAAAAIRAKEEKAKEVVETNLEDDHVYYIACRRWHPGVFLKGKPGGVLTSSDWWSSYKELDAEWPYTGMTCQVCGVRLRIKKTQGGFYPFPRFLKKMSNTTFQVLTEEGEVPA